MSQLKGDKPQFIKDIERLESKLKRYWDDRRELTQAGIRAYTAAVSALTFAITDLGCQLEMASKIVHDGYPCLEGEYLLAVELCSAVDATPGLLNRLVFLKSGLESLVLNDIDKLGMLPDPREDGCHLGHSCISNCST